MFNKSIGAHAYAEMAAYLFGIPYLEYYWEYHALIGCATSHFSRKRSLNAKSS